MALLGSLLSLGGLVACVGSEPLPPLPNNPEDWELQAEGLSWSGALHGHMRGRLRAEQADGQWASGAPQGRFQNVVLDLWSADTGILLVHIESERADGTWPVGPLRFEAVEWSTPTIDESGALPWARWEERAGWSCEGCPLESLGL